MRAVRTQLISLALNIQLNVSLDFDMKQNVPCLQAVFFTIY